MDPGRLSHAPFSSPHQALSSVASPAGSPDNGVY
jgi:hypothetical protein